VINISKKGYKQTEEHKQKVSLALKGKYKGLKYEQRYGKEKAEQKRVNFSNSMKGHKHSDKTKRKIGDANKGNILGTWEERFNKDYIEKRKFEHSERMKQLAKGTWEERFGREKAKEIREERKKSWEERFGREKANILKENYKQKRKLRILPLRDNKIEVKIQEYLKLLELNFYTHQYRNEIEHSYQCDIFIPIYNLIIECDGNYWHNYPNGRDIDKIRTSELINKGFRVLRLWESNIKNMSLQQFEEILKQKCDVDLVDSLSI
jgi:very-short-patch-repair endonuclease